MTQSARFCGRFPSCGTVAVLAPILCLVCLLFSCLRLQAQVENGVNGTVVDSTGAVIVGATVTVTNNATGVVAHAVTSSAGTFTVVGLTAGSYTAVVDARGFQRVTTQVSVEVARMASLNLTMVPGSSSETVHVSENNVISLNTESPGIGTTLEPELVQTAPIEINSMARQIDAFMYTAPGVQGNAGSHNIDGGVNFENEVLFNGVPVAFADYAGNQTNINPPYEMVNEFRVNSSTFDARYGIGMGAVTYNMASGTNQLHGDAFEILRNQLFDSDGFFPTNFGKNGNPIPPVDQQNNYGFTLGGPVMLPEVYDGRNRTFFHFSADWFKQNQAQNAIGTVPTPAMTHGDFSNFVDANGHQIPIYDPLTGKPFPGNIIPASRISAIAKTVIPSIPAPDRPGIVYGLQDNKSPAVHSLPISQLLWGYTIDHNISPSQSIHFSQWRDKMTSPFFSQSAIVPQTNELQSLVNNADLGSGFLLNYVKTVSQNLVVTAGADWIGNILGQHDGLTGVNFPGVVGSTTFPDVGFDGQNAITNWGAYGGGFISGFTDNTNRRLGIVLDNNWLWTKGRNTFNIGGEFRRAMQDLFDCAGCGGAFAFSQRSTSIPNASDPNFGSYGSSFASFLLGEVDSGTRIMSKEIRLRNKAFSSYIQDDIKLNDRLTLNAGLRWDIMVPFTENNNSILYVNETEPNPGAGGLPGAMTKFGNCSGCAGLTRADIDWKNFGPRLGLSYQLNSKTVLQAGFYKVFMDGGAYEFGTSQAALYMTTLLQGEFYRNTTNTSAPGYGNWDALPMPLPGPTPFTPEIGNGNGFVVNFHPHRGDPQYDGLSPYDQAWNFNVQRQLPWNQFITIAYVGNRAIHLPVTLVQPDQAPLSVLKYGNLLGELVTSPDAAAAGIRIPYPDFVQQFGASATVIQALEPYPQFASFGNNYEHDGTAFYNALQVQGEKRFSNGLSYMADLTLARNMANTATGSPIFSPNGENSVNEKPEYAVASNDQGYITNFIVTYELPVGPGQRYLNSRGPLAQALGGWQFSTLLTYAGGFPMGAANSYNPLVVNGFDRPNVVPGVRMKTYNYGRSRQFFTGRLSSQPIQFTTDAFVNTGAFQLGDAMRAYPSLRTPPLGIENFDAIKTFHLSERVQASLRVDYFNAFNRTQFQAPDTNSLDSTFGQITNLSSQISNRQGQATFRVEF